MRPFLVSLTTAILIATSSHAQNAWNFVLGDTDQPVLRLAGPEFVQAGNRCRRYLNVTRAPDRSTFEYVRVFCTTPTGTRVEVDGRNILTNVQESPK